MKDTLTLWMKVQGDKVVALDYTYLYDSLDEILATTQSAKEPTVVDKTRAVCEFDDGSTIWVQVLPGHTYLTAQQHHRKETSTR